MSPATWIDTPGSVLSSTSEPLDFTVTTTSVAVVAVVTWIDTPSSVLPSRDEPIDFVVHSDGGA